MGIFVVVSKRSELLLKESVASMLVGFVVCLCRLALDRFSWVYVVVVRKCSEMVLTVKSCYCCCCCCCYIIIVVVSVIIVIVVVVVILLLLLLALLLLLLLLLL